MQHPEGSDLIFSPIPLTFGLIQPSSSNERPVGPIIPMDRDETSHVLFPGLTGRSDKVGTGFMSLFDFNPRINLSCFHDSLCPHPKEMMTKGPQFDRKQEEEYQTRSFIFLVMNVMNSSYIFIIHSKYI